MKWTITSEKKLNGLHLLVASWLLKETTGLLKDIISVRQYKCTQHSSRKRKEQQLVLKVGNNL